MQAVGEMRMETGGIDPRRMIPIRDIANTIEADVCTVLPAVTACVIQFRPFVGVGKMTTLALIRTRSNIEFACLQVFSGI